MMRKVYLLLILLIMVFSLASCDSREGLEQYVGTYKISINYKRMYHYYLGNGNIKSDNQLVGNFTLEIKEDGTVTATYEDGKSQTGTVSCDYQKIKFRNIDNISSYEFKYEEKGDSIVLDYSYTEDKYGLEYDYWTERLTFERKVAKEISGTLVFKCMQAYHTITNYYETYSNVVKNDRRYNNLEKGSLKVNFDDLTFTVSNDREEQSGTISVVDKKITFHLDEENPLIPVEKEFTYKDHEQNYRYISIIFSEKESVDDYEVEDKYDIGYSCYVG